MKKIVFILLFIVNAGFLPAYEERSIFSYQAANDLEKSGFIEKSGYSNDEEIREGALWDDWIEYARGKLVLHQIRENGFKVSVKNIHDGGISETLYENGEKASYFSEINGSFENYTLEKENYVMGINHGEYHRIVKKSMERRVSTGGSYNRSSYMNSYEERKGEYILGEKNGFWYYDDGERFVSKGEYIYGIRNGTWQIESERERKYGNFVLGTEDGLWLTYSYNDTIPSKINYRLSVYHGYYEYRKENATEIGRYNAGIKDGIWTNYDSDGNPREESEYRNGDRIRRE